MSDVLTGKGPQPPRVYWIRRGLVAVAGIVLIVLLVWAFGPKGGPTQAVPAGESPSVAPTTTTPESATPTPSPASSSPSATPSRTPSATPSPTAPTACEPIGVQLELKGFSSVKADGKQTFMVTVENNTAMPCVLAIGKDNFVLRVNSGSDPIWSTAHCEKWLPTVKKQTLKAGATVEFPVAWDLFRSTAGCKQVEGQLGAGTYVATAAYAETSTVRFPFAIKK